MNITGFIIFLTLIIISFVLSFKIKDKNYRVASIFSVIFIFILTLITIGIFPVELSEKLGGGSKFKEKYEYQENKIQEVNIKLKKSDQPDYKTLGKDSLNNSLKD